MKRIAVVAAVGLFIAACGNVLDNITVDINIDGRQIFADTCQDLADQLADTIDAQLAEVDRNSDADLPDIDVDGIVDRADDLGCSPDELRQLVDDRLAGINSVSVRAKGFVVDLRDRFEER